MKPLGFLWWRASPTLFDWRNRSPWGQKNGSTRHRMKQRAAQKASSLHLQLACSPTLTFLFHSFILSLLSSKVVALFQSIAWAEGEQCKHTLLLWILVRNPIRPSSSPYSPSLFSLLLFPPTLSSRAWKGELKQACCKGKLFSVLPFLFLQSVLFSYLICVSTNTYFPLTQRDKRGKNDGGRLPTKDIIIDCKLRSIPPSQSHLCPCFRSDI